MGCGDGHFASLTFDRKIDVGLDPWTGPIHEAGRRGCYRLLVQADGAQSPFPDGYFASAFSNSVLEHIPQIEAVLADTARVLKPGAPFYFCVPNERYLSELSISRCAGEGLHRMVPAHLTRCSTLTVRRSGRSGWSRPGSSLERWWHYFSPSAMRVLEWGHYFGLPSLVARKLTGKWIIAPDQMESLADGEIRPAVCLRRAGRRWHIHVLYCQKNVAIASRSSLWDKSELLR